jgi:hypothetical protein
MNKHYFLKTTSISLVLLGAVAGCSAPQEGEETANRPNIVWLFSDDHAYQAIGSYPGRFENENLTPNIDTLAHDGMAFDRGFG